MASNKKFRSISRLIIGGAIVGIEGLTNRLKVWEDQAQIASAPPDKAEGVIVSQTQLSTASPPSSEPQMGQIETAAIGMFFSSQERIESYISKADRATRVLGKLADQIGGPFYRSRWMSPLRNQINDMEYRGQQTVNRWIAIGREEAAHSRQLARIAISERVNEAIDNLSSNQEVRELVQSHSAGLVDNVIEETRERTVSADNLLETVVRSVLRKPPRTELPEPPSAFSTLNRVNYRPSNRR